MAKISGLAHVGIFVKDVKTSQKFYEDLLGFKTEWECEFSDPANTYTVAIIRNGDLAIELVQKKKQTPLGEGPTDHVAMLVDDIEGMIKQLKEKGIKFETEEVVYREVMLANGSKWIFFRGPDNEHIELTQIL
jgi:catechol 2,3-dioxygenase-like lactoylglutathione lyase family enzyme